MRNGVRSLNVFLFLLLAFFSGSIVSAHERGLGAWPHGPAGMGWFGPFGMILFWIFFVAAAVFLIRWLLRSNEKEGPDRTRSMETPMDILKRRYASGDIAREDFEKMKKDINEEI